MLFQKEHLWQIILLFTHWRIKMDYYICSTSVIDNLHFSNGDVKKNVAGGAGIYALAGARLWHESTKLICGAGNNYAATFSKWYRDNHLAMDYLKFVNEKTPINNVHYFDDGERIEIPEYGKDHYKKFEVTVDDILPLLDHSCGIYIFRNTASDFWLPILANHHKSAKILWEIAADACENDNLPNVREICQSIDVLSINLLEAKKLLQVETEVDAIKELKQLNVPLVFLRLGKKGQTMITEKNTIFVPSFDKGNVVDVTGGGNSSSGAVLVGYCEKRSLLKIGRMASLSASMCLSQYGVPKEIDSFQPNASHFLKEGWY